MSVQGCKKIADLKPQSPWELKRVDLRTRMVRGNEVAARIELVHEERGKITDLATGEGGMETALRAIAQVMGIEGKLETLRVTGKWDEKSSAWQVSACVTVECGWLTVPGSSVAPDMLTACCNAYMDALATAAHIGIAKQPPASP